MFYPFHNKLLRWTVCFFAIFFFVLSASAKSILYVRVSFQECMVSLNSLPYLQKLPLEQENVKTIFVFKKVDAHNIARYREKYLNYLQGLDYNTIVSDKIYKRLSNKFYSTVHIFSGHEEVFSCSLNEFASNWRVAESALLKGHESKKWNRLNLPKDFRIYAVPSSIYLLDEVFEDLYYLDKSSGDFIRLSLSKEDAYKQLDIYFGHYPQRKHIHDSLAPTTEKVPGFQETGIGSVGTFADTLLVIHKVKYLDTVHYNGNSIPTWRKCYFITAYHKDSVLYRKVIERPDFKFYWVDETSGISADDSFYYISIIAKTIGNKNPMVAKWERTQGDLMKFSDGLKPTLPDYYVKNHLDYDFFELVFSYPYFMVPLSNNLYSVNESDSIALPIKMDSNDLSRLEEQIAVFGMHVLNLEHKGSVIHILYHDAKNYCFARYDLATKKLLQDGPIPGFTIKKYNNFPSFDGPDNIVYTKSGCKCLVSEPLPIKGKP